MCSAQVYLPTTDTTLKQGKRHREREKEREREREREQKKRVLSLYSSFILHLITPPVGSFSFPLLFNIISSNIYATLWLV